MIEPLLIILLIPVGASFLASVVVRRKLLVLLKSRHPNVWQELGSPSLVARNSMGNSMNVLRFLFRRRHRDLGDRDIERTGDMLLAIDAFYLIAFAALVFYWLISK